MLGQSQRARPQIEEAADEPAGRWLLPFFAAPLKVPAQQTDRYQSRYSWARAVHHQHAQARRSTQQLRTRGTRCGTRCGTRRGTRRGTLGALETASTDSARLEPFPP